MELADVALTGPEFAGVAVDTSRIPSVKLVAGGSPEADEAGADLAARCKAAGKTLVAIDFTAPVAALPNAEFYARHGMGFVMGTTGADAAALAATVDGGSHAAVIAPNMSKQIVALQAALERAAKDFPGAFSGYELSVVESHQKAKVDTSGTAKAVVASLVSLNDESVYSATDPKVTKAIENIELVRDDAAAASGMDGRLGKVPAEHLPGHAYHTYALTSGDGTRGGVEISPFGLFFSALNCGRRPRSNAGEANTKARDPQVPCASSSGTTSTAGREPTRGRVDAAATTWIVPRRRRGCDMDGSWTDTAVFFAAACPAVVAAASMRPDPPRRSTAGRRTRRASPTRCCSSPLA